MSALTFRTMEIKRGGRWEQTDCDGFLFMLPSAGLGSFISGDVKQQIASGEVYVVNGNGRGTILADGDGDMRLSVFAVRLEQMFPLLLSDEIAFVHQLAEDTHAPRLFSSSSAFARESHEIVRHIASAAALKHRGRLLEIAANYLSIEFEKARLHQQSHPPLEDNLIQVFEHLPVEELLGLPVAELAARCNCSRRHLNRLFHEHFKFSVGALKMEIRMLKALSLLRDPRAKISSVARDCGFNHPGLFATCFKRRFGTSPAQWRREEDGSCKNVNFLEDKNRTCQRLNNGFCPLASASAESNALVSAAVCEAHG